MQGSERRKGHQEDAGSFFGDHTGYYTLPEPYPVFHVTVLTHRKDAVYPATIVGIPPMEDFHLGGAALTRPAATLSHRMGEGLGG